jgi:quinolinate synthase
MMLRKLLWSRSLPWHPSRSVSSASALRLPRVSVMPLSVSTRQFSSSISTPTSSNIASNNSSNINSSRFSTAAAAAATATAPYDQSVDVFPSLIIGADRTLQPVGSFAESQATFLSPDPASVQALVDVLKATDAGIVAHYYMDVELQGVLQAAAKADPLLADRIGVADSLAMGDMAVRMAKSGVKSIACLGVDFMSESVATILETNGYKHVPVYRAAEAKIGCSLAESAERDSYRAWLQKESAGHEALHVVYINTSLETKALSSSLVPTITCTSSNVLNTILQASAQMGPNLKILYGPDTYMGDNLVTMLTTLLETGKWTDEQIAQNLHPMHNRETLAQLRDSMSVFPSGNCVVHHMFGHSVVDAVRRNYDDCYVTAHLEVPGEMFEIAMEKSLRNDGVVGSTSDILKFIAAKVTAATESNITEPQRLKFILGTEAGMVTSIVQAVQDILEKTGSKSVQAEIIFPVSSEAVTVTDESDGTDNASGLGIVPGVSGGDGCSTAGGCATCPFMKMNSLDALLDVLEMVQEASESSDTTSTTRGTTPQLRLQGHLPPARLRGKVLNGRPATELGTEAIQYMRDLMIHKVLPEDLVQKIQQHKDRPPQ